MIRKLLTCSEELQSKLEPIITTGESKNSRYSFSEIEIADFQSILSHYSTCSFMDNKWPVQIASSSRQSSLYFPICMQDTDAIILRALVLDYMVYFASISSCKRIIHDSIAFLSFLKEHNIHIENCHNSIIDHYKNHLDSKPELSACQKNNLMRAVGSLFAICSTHELLQGDRNINCTYRWKEQTAHKRAPDSCVITSLDILFFDMKNKTIPDSYRCVYFLLRLIANRINEVLSMAIECLSYPSLDVYSVSIPTAKETPYHMPINEQYPRKLNSWSEGLMYETIRMQQIFAKQAQSELADDNQGYLFVSPNYKRIINTDEFNKFLERICVSNNILDADGKPAHVTSHDFRHVAIGERLRGGIISPIQTMIESNHSSLAETMGYGYSSPKDEAAHLGAISSKVLQSKLGVSPHEKDTFEPTVLPKHKYHTLENQPFTRLIPGYGICCDVSCSPRYAKCFKCTHFDPNALYLEFIENGIILLENKITMLINKRGSEEAIRFNQNQLELFHLFVEKITAKRQSATA